MINVGVIGLGNMGLTHLDVYAQHGGVKIAAIADANPDRLSGKASADSNIQGQAEGKVDLTDAARYADAHELIADPAVDLIDICLPTPTHASLAIQAMNAGKHVLIEKPLARTHAQALEVVEASKQAPGKVMCAMCMRFWPGWDWLKHVVNEKTYGRVLAAHFSRLTSHPRGRFYADGDACGGAILDLHLHDTDFVHYCFGMPEAVSSRGYKKVTNCYDHVLTQYLYPDRAMVSAEGGWVMAEGFEFQMRYTVNFENATAEFWFDGKGNLRLTEAGKEPLMIELPDELGYKPEIYYFLDCIRDGRQPTTVTLAQAAESIRLIEAEIKSIDSGGVVAL